MHAIAEANGSTTSTDIRVKFGGINQSQLAGWLSSVGFTMKKLDLPRPYDTGWETDAATGEGHVTYVMTPDVVGATLEILDADGRLR